MNENKIGLSINKMASMINVDRITNVVMDVLSNASPKYIDKLENLHNFFNPDDINPLRINSYAKLNKIRGIHDLLWEIAGDEISNIVGPDVLVQNKLNLSIQMPNDSCSVLPIHSDCWSADSPYQINLWIPLTDCEATSSMFIIDYERTKIGIQDLYKNLSNPSFNLEAMIKSSDFIKVNYGEYLLFNPGLLHGNVVNRTNRTRVSVNIRYKSANSPGSYLNNISRGSGIYYKLYKKSKWTELAKSLDALNKNEI